MAWRPFATQLETAETLEVVGLNMRAPALHSALRNPATFAQDLTTTA
jgi:purine nucleoside permease